MGSDVPSPTDTGVVTDTGVPLVPAKAGAITMTATRVMLGMMTINSTNIGGSFADSTGVVGGCTTQTMGDCQVVTCAGGGSMSRIVSAGDISIAGGSGGNIMLMRSAMNAYTFNSMTERLPANSMLTVTATGDAMGVPAFSGMVAVPGPIGLTMPSLTPGGTLTIVRSMPLVLTWSGGAAGRVQVVLSAGAMAPSVTCSFMAAGATGTVPPSVLMMLPAGNGGIAVTSANRTDVMAGEYRVSLFANTAAGIPVSRVMFQ
jgi:hypothetical protein